jgi:hypothetical protein
MINTRAMLMLHAGPAIIAQAPQGNRCASNTHKQAFGPAAKQSVCHASGRSGRRRCAENLKVGARPFPIAVEEHEYNMADSA